MFTWKAVAVIAGVALGLFGIGVAANVAAKKLTTPNEEDIEKEIKRISRINGKKSHARKGPARLQTGKVQPATAGAR
jgi:hypothetical protein